MANAEKKDANLPVAATEKEDEKTLAAIDRGIRDADAGRVTPIEEVEKMISQWISKSSSPTRR
jgi:predicted transcriptional regulator